jgi:hypothetical protein
LTLIETTAPRFVGKERFVGILAKIRKKTSPVRKDNSNYLKQYYYFN